MNLREYMKKAIFDNLLEFEIIYGNTLKKDSKRIDKNIPKTYQENLMNLLNIPILI